jgi:hypothetical protein
VQSGWIAVDPADDAIEPFWPIANRRNASKALIPASCRPGDQMSHSEIAPHLDRSAVEPLAQQSRAEIIDRYRRFRVIR